VVIWVQRVSKRKPPSEGRKKKRGERRDRRDRIEQREKKSEKRVLIYKSIIII
jgi:hypothetical protein